MQESNAEVQMITHRTVVDLLICSLYIHVSMCAHALFFHQVQLWKKEAGRKYKNSKIFLV